MVSHSLTLSPAIQQPSQSINIWNVRAIHLKSFAGQRERENGRKGEMGSACMYRQANVEAWFFSPLEHGHDDPRLPHQFIPNRPVSALALQQLGVLVWEFDAQEEKWESNEDLQRIFSERGYKYWDVSTVAPGHMEDYDEKIKHFFTEHLHADEEIRFVLQGSGYFDVRDEEERWIRFRVKPGYLIVLPPGMYHRFCLDSNDFIKAVKVFKGVPHWTQHQRPADDMAARKEYLKKVLGVSLNSDAVTATPSTPISALS